MGRKVEFAAKFEGHRSVDIQVTDAGHLAETLAVSLGGDIAVRSTKAGTLILGFAAPFVDPDEPAELQEDALAEYLEVAVSVRTWWYDAGKAAVASALETTDAETAPPSTPFEADSL